MGNGVGTIGIGNTFFEVMDDTSTFLANVRGFYELKKTTICGVQRQRIVIDLMVSITE